MANKKNEFPAGAKDTRAAIRRRDVLLSGSALMAARFVAATGTTAVAANMFLGSPAQAETSRPNILFILADDLGWKDVGFHGSDIKTPNIDKLAETGARLEEFYVQPMCTPTRAAFMTGRYPLRYGLQTAVIPSGGKYGLATDEWLLPQTLKEAGYDTSLVGKWHLGHSKKEYWPGQRGFDKTYGPLIGEIDHFKHETHGVVDWYRDNKLLHEQGYDTALFGAEAVRQINKHDVTVPLFMYLAFTAPHTPYQAPKEYLDMYKGIADPGRQAYAAQITAMDDQIGKVIDALDKRKMRENTLVVFVSDNGGTRSKLFAGEGAVKGELPPNNGEYRDGKGSVYEGGTRVVALANWPGRVKPGEVKEMIHIVDMYPTMAGLAGAKLGKNKPLDGLDVWSAIGEGKPSPRDEIVYNIEPYRGAVRKGNWKLVWLVTLPSNLELFDLAKDPSEATNLAEKNPEKVKELQARIEALAKEAVPPLFMMELVKIGLSAEPAFPGGDTTFAGED
ncbi:arylsulfatase [Mesorhizobium sp. LNHC209A00]|uniref:arylsulfatase B n=1 Tax=Mesorhizobium TaxID=68287 RepID=UPI0003D040C2|nr:arylsulfatase [Mesorhizobium sp. LNHC209A00]ESY89835.1 sulfatase [Mesorhizobium sp. LNHC209A00]